MALNQPLYGNGMPVAFVGEMFVLARDGVEFEVDKIPESSGARRPAQGTVFHSLIQDLVQGRWLWNLHSPLCEFDCINETIQPTLCSLRSCSGFHTLRGPTAGGSNSSGGDDETSLCGSK
ncbi:hypothetical protein QJS10_CPB22g00374 [Acorus calamus]|uniref:Uncharacterized protein n=1 Tax=Acorus calamus TaxID=4465 RepID=A0AAV9BZC4_ACOCL|nr:hypothetical protein QJS10_CPB22g00374 [Acorus calamus]